MKRHWRQKIIDGYLLETGRNHFIAPEFIDWLADKPEHEAYELFYGKSDEDAAREWRIDQARRFVSGLRITVTRQHVEERVVRVVTHEFPAYASPMDGRRSGGGYSAVDPDDPESMAELRRQGASSLRGWLSRYRGAFEAAGYDLSGIEAVADVDAKADAA